MKINIDSIIIDPGLQRRVSINKQVVEDYAEAYKAGVAFDDVIVYRVEDKLYLVDGFHRVEGATLAGKKNIDASERAGTYRQAWIYSLGVNAHHGLQRSREDKRNAVQDALADEEIGKWSNMKIAEVCAVSASLVDKVKHEAVTSHMGSEEVTYTTKHGTKAKMKTANIGQPKASAQKPETVRAGAGGNPADSSDALAPDDAFEGQDPLDQLEATLKENEALRKTVEKLSATDQGAVLAKALEAKKYAEDEQGKAMNIAAQYQKEVKAWQAWWAKVVLMVKLEKRSDLLGWIKARL